MEVLRNNFQVHLKSFKDSIHVADFVSIDAEFSGLTPGPQDRIDIFDTIQRRYEKVRNAANQFMVLQVGVCLFMWSKQKRIYEAKPFNFYVFPRSGTRFAGLDRPFLSQPSSLEFLAQNKFDFNKWVNQGIPYVSRDDETFLRSKINASNNNADIVIDERNQSFVETAMTKVQEWLQTGGKEGLSITTPTSFHKRLIHQETKKRFNGFVATSSTRTTVDLVRLTEDQRKEKLSREDETLQQLDELIGFREVTDIIASSQKPVIGHNMLMDLCILYRHFNGRMPETIEEFKVDIRNWLPRLYDTKCAIQRNDGLSTMMTITNLETIYEEVIKPTFPWPKVEYAEGFDSYKSQLDRYHEAGFDAYITGLAFVRMVAKVQGWKDSQPIDFSSKFVQDLENKLYLMRSDIPLLDLASQSSHAQPKNIFMIHDFPSTWKSSNIYNALKDVGQVTLKWLDDNSCLVMIRDPNKVAVAIALQDKLAAEESPEFRFKQLPELPALGRKDGSGNQASPSKDEKNPNSITKEKTQPPSSKRKREDTNEGPSSKNQKASGSDSCSLQ